MDNDVQGERKAGMRLSSCVFIAVVFSLSSAVSHAREAWRFLPCFGKDVRGGMHAAADGHFYSEVPAQARPLLSEDGGLDESFFAFSDFFSKSCKNPMKIPSI